MEEVLSQGGQQVYYSESHSLSWSVTDDDLTAMYLTDKMNSVHRELHDHEELEVLLESFSKQVEEIVNEVENIQVSPFICPDGALPVIITQ